MRPPADVADDGATRALLAAAAVLVFLAGLQLFVFPARTADWFAWTIDPPMTAAFLGASYWASAVLEVSGARAGYRARLSAWSVLAFTVVTLVVTLVHLDKFHLGGQHPASATAVAWGWLAVYAVVPVLLVVVLARQGRGSAPTVASRRLPTALRALLAVLAVLLGLVGVALLVVPDAVGAEWPWPLTVLTARAVGAWLVGLGWVAAHAALVDDADAARGVGWTGAAFAVLQAVALARHGDDLAWSDPAAAAYVLGLAAVGGAGAWILSLHVRAPR